MFGGNLQGLSAPDAKPDNNHHSTMKTLQDLFFNEDAMEAAEERKSTASKS
jgi:hypothetical protein